MVVLAIVNVYKFCHPVCVVCDTVGVEPWWLSATQKATKMVLLKTKSVNHCSVKWFLKVLHRLLMIDWWVG